MERIVFLVTDRVYKKTRRYIEKIRRCAGDTASINLVLVSGFPQGICVSTVSDCVSTIFEGTVQEIAQYIGRAVGQRNVKVAILALNESSILPAIAIRRNLGIESPSGYIESCDKRKARDLLARQGTKLELPYCEVSPGENRAVTRPFESDRYVVKPAYGMSSSDVKIFDSWDGAKLYAESTENARPWVPDHVAEALNNELGRTDGRIIESYVDGTEFSIDGWVGGSAFTAIVQHKLCMVQGSFIGDGPTVSPPIVQESLPTKWSGLSNSEEAIWAFGRDVLDAIGFSHGVFHIEGRERFSDRKLVVIEVNPRAPGGSLWKSALIRSGYDLELVDILLQLGEKPTRTSPPTPGYTLHYPFYAGNPGVLVDWGELAESKPVALPNLQIDYAAELGDIFGEKEMSEEPYLAFAVIHDKRLDGILAKCEAILNLRPPEIRPG